MKIIGISGTNGSGKDTVSKLLADQYGFYAASATDMLGDELTRRGLPHERENKRTLSAQWRREHGMGVIVDKAVEAAKAAGLDKIVVGSLRNPGEVDRVHELGGTMIWIDADPKVRYERIQSRVGRVEDRKTFEEFLAEEEAEMNHSGDEATLNMSGVKAKADRFLDNETENIEDFKAQAEDLLKDLL
jgi:dephospho-CoA kinase